MTGRIPRLRNSIFYSVIYRVSFEVALDMLFGAIYHFYTIEWENGVDVYGNIVAFITAI